MLCGYQTNPAKYMKHADWLVHSALYEGMSNVVLEAMALSLPIICTDCAGTRELLTPERSAGDKVDHIILGQFGIVCRLDADKNDIRDKRPTRGEKALAEAMILVLKQPELKTHYSTASHKRAEAFGKERVINDWEQLLQELTE